MKPKYNKNIIIMVLILFCLSTIYCLFVYSTPNKFVSPDETINYFFIDLYSETGNLSYTDKLNEISFGVIRPRGAVYFSDHIAPQKFIGFIILVGTIESVVDNISRFISPIFALVGLLYIYIISRELFNKKIAILTPIFLGILPYYWYWTSLSMFENILGTSFFIIFVRYFLKMIENDNFKNYAISAIFLSMAIFIRAELFLIVPVIVAILFYNFHKKNKLSISRIFIFALIFFIFILPLFLLNNDLYGGYLTTGQHVQYHYEEALPINSGFNLYNILENILNIFWLYPLFLLGIILGIFSTLTLKDNIYKSYISLLGVGFLVFSTYILSDRVLDSHIHSSYVRYFLPFIVLLSPFFSIFIIKIKRMNSYLVIIVITYFIIFSAITTTISLQSNKDAVENYEKMNEKILNATEYNAIIFLDYWDKAIFPERRVGLIRELPQQGNHSKMLASIAIKIYETHTPVYILMDNQFSNYILISEFTNELSEQGYYLVPTKVNSLCKLNRMM